MVSKATKIKCTKNCSVKKKKKDKRRKNILESKERTALDSFYTGIPCYRFCNCKLDSIIKWINWLKLRELRGAGSRDVFAAGLQEVPNWDA